MKGLLWFLALAVLAVGLSLGMSANQSRVIVVMPHRQAIEVSLNTVICGSALLFVMLHLFLRGLSALLALPRRVRDYREQKRQRKALSLFQEAVRHLIEGRFGQAIKKAAAAHATGEAPGLAALVAARAAQQMRDTKEQARWLETAAQERKEDQVFEAARLMLTAEIQIEAGRYDEALSMLAEYKRIAGRHLAAMRLELRARQGARQWPEVLRLIRQLEKRVALPEAEAYELKQQAYCAIIAGHAGDPAGLSAYLQEIPENDISNRVIRVAVDTLQAQGAYTASYRLIERQHARGPNTETLDETLLQRYAEGDEELTRRLAFAESCLETHSQDARLLFLLGRLCLRQQLWGKAQAYLEAAQSIKPLRDISLALAALAEQLGHHEEANRHYRAAAQLAEAG